MVRFKQRWILFELVQDPTIKQGNVVFKPSPINVTEEILAKALRDAVMRLAGPFGQGMVWNATVKWYNPDTRVGIIRVPREFADLYSSAMFLLKQVNNYTCHFSILHVSGTIIFAQKQAIERNRLLYLEEQTRQEQLGNTYKVADKIQVSTAQIEGLTID